MPEEILFDVKYDRPETLNSIKIFEELGGFPPLLESLGLKIENKQDISKGEIFIGWEDYEENYINKNNLEQNNIEIDDSGNDDDEINFNNFNGVIPVNFMGLAQETFHMTPWGKFLITNPLSPANLYKLQVAHFKGFSVKSITNFQNIMNNIEGVSIWAQIDPYSIVIAPAKSYSPDGDCREVKNNVERAIYQALGVEIDNGFQELEDHIIIIGEKSKSLFDKGTPNISIVFPEPNFSVETIIENIDEKLKEVDSLFERIDNLIVFYNGEFYEPNNVS